MNGFITKTVAGLCLGSGLTTLAGCYTYRNLVDPCYPERYNYQAREEIHAIKDAQAAQGHKLDQTVWTNYFETSVDPKTNETKATDKLNPMGIQHLNYLTRRKPNPDPKLYLQTSGDEALDRLRQEAVVKYLHGKMTLIQPGFVFEIPERVDPTEVGIPALPIAAKTIPEMYRNYTGTLTPSGGSR